MSHRSTRALAYGLMTLGPCLGTTNLWLIATHAQFVPWPVLPPTTAGGHFLLGFTAMSCVLGGRRLLRRLPPKNSPRRKASAFFSAISTVEG